MIQAAAIAEKSAAPEIEVMSFRDLGPRSAHSAKASLSPEYLQRGLKLVGWAIRTIGLPDHVLGGYTDHLAAIGTDFVRLRGTIMYVDYEDGTWTRGRPLDKDFIETDIEALNIVATLLEAVLQDIKSFGDVVELFTKMEHEARQKLPDVIREVIVRLTEQAKSRR